jgi:anti-sigma factor RsiW
MTETEVPDWQLERYRLAELSASEMAVVARRAAEDARVQARLSALDASDAELLRERPPSRVVAAIRAQAEPPRRQGLPLLPALVAGLGLAAVIFVLVPGAKAPDAIRVKGLAPRLLLYRQVSGSSAEALEQGSVARQDDLVQIA